MRLPQSLKNFWRKSQTKLLASTQAASGLVLLTLDQFNSWFNNPTVKGYLSELSLPKSITIGLVILGIITYIAHAHGDD